MRSGHRPKGASQCPDEFVRAQLRLSRILCSDYLLGVRRRAWGITELAA
jgi:hypothetical protein